jgi:predicted RND superfamily exporter protein
MTAIEMCIAVLILGDIRRLLPLVFAVVMLCLWPSFRRLLGVLLPLLTVIVCSL